MDSTLLICIAVVALAGVAAWLFFTWYHADDEPVFARDNGNRVTFKIVLQSALRDLAEITRPLWLRAWLNAPFIAVMALDAVSLLQESLRNAIFGNTMGGLALVALNLLARYGATAAHAPIAPSSPVDGYKALTPQPFARAEYAPRP